MKWGAMSWPSWRPTSRPSSWRASPLPSAMRPSALTPEEQRALDDLVAYCQRREAALTAFSEAELARLRRLKRRYQIGRPDEPGGGAAV